MVMEHELIKMSTHGYTPGNDIYHSTTSRPDLEIWRSVIYQPGHLIASFPSR
jgi:hypothetical protein